MAGQMGIHNSVINRYMQRLQQTGMVDERSRSGRSLQNYTQIRSNIAQCAKRNCSATLASIRNDLNCEGYVSVRTVSNSQHLS